MLNLKQKYTMFQLPPPQSFPVLLLLAPLLQRKPVARLLPANWLLSKAKRNNSGNPNVTQSTALVWWRSWQVLLRPGLVESLPGFNRLMLLLVEGNSYQWGNRLRHNTSSPHWVNARLLSLVLARSLPLYLFTFFASSISAVLFCFWSAEFSVIKVILSLMGIATGGIQCLLLFWLANGRRPFFVL